MASSAGLYTSTISRVDPASPSGAYSLLLHFMKLSGTKMVFSRLLKPMTLPFITPSRPLPRKRTYKSSMLTTPSESLGSERLWAKPKL